MREHLLIHGFTREERHAATWRMEDAIVSNGGFILQATLFSNKSLAISFEIRAAAVRELRRRLDEAGITLFEESVSSLDRFSDNLDDDDTADVPGVLNVAFIHDDPDEKTEVPSVPG